MKRINITLPEELIDRVNAAAKAEGRSRSNWIARLCDLNTQDGEWKVTREPYARTTERVWVPAADDGS